MPKGQNTFNSLLRGKRKRGKGSLEGALAECWLLIRVCAAARDEAMEAENFDEVHRFVQLEISALRAYGSLAIPGDLELRIKTIEARVVGSQNGHIPVLQLER